jgi:cytochrome P450
LRALIGQAFTNEVLDAAAGPIRATVSETVASWAGEEEVELYSRFTNPLPLTLILDFLGVPRERHDDVREWDDAWARLFTSAHAIEDQLDAVRAVVAYQQYLDGLIEQRRAEPADDLISRCVHARRGDYEPLTNAELVWQCMGLLAAGHATTTDAVTQLLLLLLSQGRWREVVEGVYPLEAVVEEGLRMVNPVLGLPRVTTREVTLGGVTLPEGAEVLVSFCAANRDEAYVERPSEFDPGRADPRRHMGFGWGVHACIGAKLSKMIITSILEELRTRTPDLALAPGYQPEFTQHPFLWGVAKLRVRPGGDPITD